MMLPTKTVPILAAGARLHNCCGLTGSIIDTKVNKLTELPAALIFAHRHWDSALFRVIYTSAQLST
jgi:hypothetical protein